MSNNCKVIWSGRQPLEPKNGRRYRLVYRGPARDNRPDDVPFAVENCLGMSMMKRLNWGKPGRDNGAEQEGLWAVGHALGLVLMVKPEDLVAGHPIHCELNMAVVEGRVSRGCDCKGPPEPVGQVEG